MPKKFDDMKKSIKRNLRKNHPDWSDEHVENSSWAIATKQWQKIYGTNP